MSTPMPDSTDKKIHQNGSRPMTLDDLPPPDTRRWVSRRKALVVCAVRDGLLTREAACERYDLSIEEYLSWERLVDSFGVPGLRATRIQDYRQIERTTLTEGTE